jgi:signal peptidase I, bacterial type
MNELDDAMRNLVDRDVMPIAFDEIANDRHRPRERRTHVLVALACAAAVVVLAFGAVVIRGWGSNGSSTPVGSVPPASASDPADGSQVLTQPSESMSPLLKTGDRFSVDTLTYSGRDPMRGDVVAMNVPTASGITGMTVLVKRIVGLPGETIEGRDGRIYVDGGLLDEASYLSPAVQSSTFDPVQIPEGMYFVLGDNRHYSNDSAIFGPVARSEFLGLVTKVP